MIKTTMDGNAAASYISYAFSEVAIIYPITPSSPMAELADEAATNGKVNLFGSVPRVVQMQSESGVAGAVHGALTCGALTTTYTCSQGLLLMQPNMFKIAGELLPTVFHVSARAIATHALNIFGDHQDVMACRQTGFAFLCSASVQEVMDLALVAHLATLKSSVPFVHFFDGFRTSHELNKIDKIEYAEIKTLLDEQAIARFRARALSPDQPVQRGTAQNGDIYFQNREAANSYYLALPSIVQNTMNAVAKITGRSYRLFDYFGAPDAKFISVIMGSGASVMEETVEKMCEHGEKVGVIKVRLYRPFDTRAFVEAIPKSCEKIVVLDRTKEAGAPFEPLALDVFAALSEAGLSHIRITSGRYGLGSKDFTPSMCYAVFENLKSDEPKNRFTVGIVDDITHTSLDLSTHYETEQKGQIACKFFGLGSDGTVGANKNSIKIIGEHTENFVQGYFYYDSRKSGGVTVSHLRFGKTPIRASYLIDSAHFIACHNHSYLTRYDILDGVKKQGVFLLNCPCETDEQVSELLPPNIKRKIAENDLRFFVIDATKLSNEAGLNGRTGTIMQAAFFLLHPSLMPYEKAKTLLKEEIVKVFSRKGEKIVEINCAAIDKAEAAVREMHYPSNWKTVEIDAVKGDKGEYYRDFIHPVLSLRGDKLPVSAFIADGSVPTGTTRLEKHGMPYALPKWIPENCIQCNQCSFVCPHACIRPFVLPQTEKTPDSFVTIPAVGVKDAKFRVQVSPHDCMGCAVCANTCPAKEKALVMHPATQAMPNEGENWEFAQTATKADVLAFKRNTVKGSQFQKPLFEFSYACSGCGETPYIKLLTQLFGERMVIANATGCSSIYGGSAPTCPYTVNESGQGPAWANSLFEDNAEFGFGMRLANDIRGKNDRSVWIIGGDGWAYDIGYGGLDHVLAGNANVNILVLDSEVYSNTGGQCSKATPLSAVARFAAAGKRSKKKELGLIAMTYGHVYVAQVSMGANKQQLINAFTEAESYDGPSLIIAYSPCIAHGVNMSKCMEEEKRAVESGYWQLYRFDPRLKKEGKNPFSLDSKPPTMDFKEFLLGENRFASLKKTQPNLADALFDEAEKVARERLAFYQKLSALFAP